MCPPAILTPNLWRVDTSISKNGCCCWKWQICLLYLTKMVYLSLLPSQYFKFYLLISQSVLLELIGNPLLNTKIIMILKYITKWVNGFQNFTFETKPTSSPSYIFAALLIITTPFVSPIKNGQYIKRSFISVKTTFCDLFPYIMD